VVPFLNGQAKELFVWLSSFALQNEKHAPIIKVTNFTFFVEALAPMNIPQLRKYLTYATQQAADAETKYILWMVSYEFPSLSELANRMEGVGSRVREEELALYVRR
jgi:hypothetical protein